jgi:hypothetical protein
MNTNGVCIHALGRLDEGVALIRASLELATEHQLTAAQVRASYNLAGRLMIEDGVASTRAAEAGVELARRTGRRDWLFTHSTMLSTNLVHLRLEYDRALELLAGVEAQEPPPDVLADVIVDRATIAAMRGDRAAWQPARERALTMIEGQSNPLTRWAWAFVEAMVALAEGRLEDALAVSPDIAGAFDSWNGVVHARVALRRRDAAGLRVACERQELRSATGNLFAVERIGFAAGLAALEGRPDEAVAGYRQARGLARDHGHLVTVVDLLIDAVTVLGPAHPESGPFADEARQVLDAQGARALRDRLDEALAGERREATSRR